MGLIVDGKAVEVAGLHCQSWHDDPCLRLKLPEDGRRRKAQWVRSIILHTTRGIPGGKDRRPQKILAGIGPTVQAGERVARWWSTSSLQSGAHLVVDFDGTVTCLADLLNEVAFHAGLVNEVSIGVELYQGGNAELYAGQLDATVRLCDFLTGRFGIQRQFHGPYRNGPIVRLSTGGIDCVGVFGHRDVTGNRGQGDPGDAIFACLLTAGYECFDFERGEDRAVWRGRQAKIHRDLVADGIPGPTTLAAMHRLLYIARPGDG